VEFVPTERFPVITVFPVTESWLATEASSPTIRSVVVVVPPIRASPPPARVSRVPPVEREIRTVPLATVKFELSFTYG
jgi:hypothetical protein